MGVDPDDLLRFAHGAGGGGDATTHPDDLLAFHLAGLDATGVARDPWDVFGNDPGIGVETPDEIDREHLPQFGPPFVRYTVDKLTHLERLVNKQMERWSLEPVTVLFMSSMTTTAAGLINRGVQDKAILWESQPGWNFALHRLSINAAGFNFGTPYSNAAAYWELRVNDEMIDGASLVSAALGSWPVVKTWGTRDAPHIRAGGVLSLFASTNLASVNVRVLGQGTLVRDETA